uniref:Uncharacterized protein n=1 Tax=Streptomyces sp. NBC_00049 TaxID=2903617 RepID=A0AAU2K2A3_9ACTN
MEAQLHALLVAVRVLIAEACRDQRLAVAGHRPVPEVEWRIQYGIGAVRRLTAVTAANANRALRLTHPRTELHGPSASHPHNTETDEERTGPPPGCRWIRERRRVGHGKCHHAVRRDLAIRMDRQLEEALARGSDALHLTVVFGISDRAAIRYAEAARQLLPTHLEDDR